MTDLRVLEVSYDAAPIKADIPMYDGEVFKFGNLLTLINAIIPSGIFVPYGGATAPPGWLICNGAAVSRTAYPALFAAIGTAYGVGDGSTTFNLPDMRQRFPLGKAASGTGATLGGTGGSIDHTHTSAAHTHTVPAHYHGMGTGADLNITSSGAHTHNIFGSFVTFTGAGTATYTTVAGVLWSLVADTNSANHIHSSSDFAGKIGLVTGGVDGNAAMTSGSTTPGATGSNNPPFQTCNFIIWTGLSGSSGGSGFLMGALGLTYP